MLKSHSGEVHRHKVDVRFWRLSVQRQLALLCFLRLMFSVSALFVGAASAHSEETEYAEVGRWSIVYKQFDNVNGCSAVARFADQTTVELALTQASAGKGWAVFISNPQWDSWISKGSQHALWFVTAKRWHGIFNVVNDNGTLYLHDTSIDFMNNLTDTHSLMVFDDNKRPILDQPLDMKDGVAAIKAVANCVRSHPFNGKGAPASEAETGTTISGTGFFVTPNLFLTNNHVVRECRRTIQVRYPEGQSYPATIFGQDQTDDLALLNTEMPSLSVAAFHLRPRLGESVAAYGFPYAGTLSSSGNFTLGNVASLSGMRDDARYLQTSTPIQPGNSGGPLLDMSGSVVGVVAMEINPLSVMQADNSVPQNVNFAIQVSIAIDFLATKGIAPKLDTSDVALTLPPPDVADLAKRFTVQVYCEAGPSEVEAKRPKGLPSATKRAH